MGDESKWRNRRFCGSPEGSVEVSGPLRLHCVIYDGTSSPCCAIFFFLQHQYTTWVQALSNQMV